MYPQGRRGSESDSNATSPFPLRPLPGSPSPPGHEPATAWQAQQSAAAHNDVPLPSLEAGVSPIGGVYYAATPQALHFTEHHQQQQHMPDSSLQGQNSPASPSGGSGSSIRRQPPSPSRVRKPAFGVKGAYSSMAARRYAAALAASGHADPEVLAEAIRAAAAEAEGNRLSLLSGADPSAAAAAGGGGGPSSAAAPALRSFSSTPQPPAGSSSSRTSSQQQPQHQQQRQQQQVAGGAASAAQSRALASLLSPRLLSGSTTGNPLETQQEMLERHQQQQQQLSSGVAAAAAGSGAAAGPEHMYGWTSGLQQMSPRTPAAPDARTPGLDTPGSTQGDGAATFSKGQHTEQMLQSTHTASSDWQMGSPHWPAMAGHEVTNVAAADERVDVPLASGVMGTPMRLGTRPSASEPGQASPRAQAARSTHSGLQTQGVAQQQQQQQQQATRGRTLGAEGQRLPGYMMPTISSANASQDVTSFKLQLSSASNSTRGSSSPTRGSPHRSPSPTFLKAKSAFTGAAAAAAAGAGGVVIAGMMQQSGNVAGGRKTYTGPSRSPRRSGSPPPRSPSPRRAGSPSRTQTVPLPLTTLLSLHDNVEGEASSSTAQTAWQGQQQQSPQPAAAIGVGAQQPQQASLSPAYVGAGVAAAGTAAAVAAAAAAAGPMSRPVDLASMPGSSSVSTPLSQDWQSPQGTASSRGQATRSGQGTPFMSPFASRGSSWSNPTGAQAEAGAATTSAPEWQQQTQQQQQQQQQLSEAELRPQGSQGGLLGSLWTLFSGTGRSDAASTPRPDLPTIGASTTGGSHEEASSSTALPQQPSGHGPTVAAGAATAAAAMALAGAGVHAVASHNNSSGSLGNSNHNGSSEHFSLDPVTGRVISGSPARSSGMRHPTSPDAAGSSRQMAAAAGGGQHSTHIMTAQPTYLQSLEEMEPEGDSSMQQAVLPPAAAAATFYGSPSGMGHGAPPGHIVFAPGVMHGPGTSYSPAVGGASSGSNNAQSFGDPYAAGGYHPGALAALGLGGAAAAAAAAAGGTSLMQAGGHLGGAQRSNLVADSDISSLFSNASSYGEPLQPQRLPPATWPAEALPSPTGSDMHSVFDPDSPGMASSMEQQQHPGLTEGMPDLPRLHTTAPELESSEGGAGGRGAAAALAASAALATGAAAAASGLRQQSGRGRGPSATQQYDPQVEQPVVRIKLGAAAPGSPRRRSKATQAGAEAEAKAAEQQRSSTGGARRKSGLGALWGVSTLDGKHSKPGKKPATSPEPSAPDAQGRKRRTGGGVGPKNKKHCLVCVLVPLVILLVLGGIAAAIGITMTQQRQHTAAKAAAQAAAAGAAPPAVPGPPLAFKVNVTVPPDADGRPGPSCQELFGPQADKGQLESYLSTFRQAYAKALNVSASDVRVASLACDGKSVNDSKGGGKSQGSTAKGAASKGDASGKPRPARKRSLLHGEEETSEETDASSDPTGRMLLQAAHAALPAVLTTEFTVPAPAEPGKRADLAATVSKMSPQILEPAMSQFFGRPVQVQPAVQQPLLPKPPAAAPRPAPAVPQKPPAPAAPDKKNATSPPKEEPSPAVLPESPSPGASPAPKQSPSLAPVFPEKPPTASPKPQPSPEPAAAPPPEPVSALPPPAPSPTPAGPTWSFPPVFRPVQPNKPRWPFGPQRPTIKPGAPARPGRHTPPPPPPPSPPLLPPPTAAPTAEEATPVLVTLSPPPPKSPQPARPAPGAAPTGVPTFAWPSATPCRGKANGHTATPDAEGRLWGWEDGHSCAFKTPANTPLTINWENAASCSGRATTSNSVFDGNGRLWGWQDGRSCAYRGTGVQAPPMPGQQVITWEAAPVCVGAPDARNSVRNPQGQLWGWENGKSCAFKIQNGAHTITWAAAPVCQGMPNHFTAVRDSLGRLWGWENNESCRFPNPS